MVGEKGKLNNFLKKETVCHCGAPTYTDNSDKNQNHVTQKNAIFNNGGEQKTHTQFGMVASYWSKIIIYN